MTKFGMTAVRARKLYITGKANSAEQAWETAVARFFPGSRSQRKKSCPKSAFLGLCEAGYVKGIPRGEYTRSTENKEYALAAVNYLARKNGIQSPLQLWRRVATGIVHNSQMHVVLALWQNGCIVVPRY